MNWIPKLDTPSKMPMIGASGGVVRIGMVWVQSDKRRTVRIFKSMGFRDRELEISGVRLQQLCSCVSLFSS